METRDKSKKPRRPSHQTLASMRGNLRQIIAIPEDKRTEPQHKAIIKITGALNHARNEQLEKGRKMAARIVQLEAEALVFDNQAFALMVLRALAYIATETGFISGMALRDMTETNPFMSSGAFDQLEALGYLNRLPDGNLMIAEAGVRLIGSSRRRRVSTV